MRRLVFQWRSAWWNLVLLAFLLFAVVASAQMTLSTSGLNFGSVPVGSTQTLPLTVTNNAKSSLTILQANVVGSGFSVTGPTLPINLVSQQSVSLSVTFAPQTGGPASGTISVITWAPIGNSGKQRNNTATISLSGTGQVPGYLGVSSSSMNLGSVMVGNSQSQALTLSNSGGSALTISGAGLSGAAFAVSGLSFPYTLAAGSSANLSVVFSPIAAGAASGSLSISSNASDAAVGVVLAGTGTNPNPGYLIAPTSMNLGSVTVGNTQTQAMTLSNTGASSLTISAASVSGVGFSVTGLTFPYTLAAGSSASLSVVFSPSATGSASATLVLSSNASDPSVSVALSGSGTSASGTLGLTPASMSFGNVNVGSSQSQNGSVTASGGSVTLSSASSTNSQFTLAGLSLPLTISAGQSVPFTITFSPTAVGNTSANISFFTGSSSTAEAATGVGATIQHTVELSWNASSSPSVSGYNIYRAVSAAGPYSKVNPSVNASMNYSDGTVQSGQTYYYVTTAVSSSGEESSYSNQVTAQVPMP